MPALGRGGPLQPALTFAGQRWRLARGIAVNQPAPPVTTDELARRALLAFIVTFIAARTLVFLIMSQRVPNLYFFLHGTHVHHLNYGIFLLAAVGGFVLFNAPTGRALRLSAFAYGAAMALTFDEFGMWLHLGGSYWQRASVDMVIVVSALFGLVAFARTLRRIEKHHFWAFTILMLVLVGFAIVIYLAGCRLGDLVGPVLHDLEVSSSP